MLRVFSASVVVAAALALLVALLGSTGAGAAGVPTAYVRPGGDCQTLSPCFYQIQTAVNTLAAGGTVKVLPGTYMESVNLNTMGSAAGGGQGDITLMTVDAAGQPAPGTATIHGAEPLKGVAFHGAVTVDGFVLEATAGDGLHIASQSDIAVHHVTANNPGDGVDSGDQTGDDGLDLATSAGTVTITDVTANGGTGLYNDGVQAQAAGNVTLENVTANGHHSNNDSNGIDIYQVTGNVSLTGATANDNSDSGIFVDNQASVEMQGVTANGNTYDGISIIRLSSTTAATHITGSQANNNKSNGINYYGNGSITIERTTVQDNLVNGLALYSDKDISVMRTNIIGNGSDTNAPGINAGANSGGEKIDTFTVQDSIIRDSFGEGVAVDSLLNAGTHTVTGNVICGNHEGGVLLSDGGVTVHATGNWWGNASGPRHPSNPPGTGDKIRDATNGGQGTVPFAPWINASAGGEAPIIAAAQAGLPLPVQFTFTGGSGSVSLQGGPGNPNDALPFMLHTDNGVLSSGAATGDTIPAQIENGVLGATLTAAHEGSATVSASGPCGLQGQFDLQVEPAPPQFLKGDIDCDGSVTSVDALFLLRHVALLPVNLGAGCPAIDAAAAASVSAATARGDIDCDGGITSVDALFLLRHVALLPVNLPEGCAAIGV